MMISNKKLSGLCKTIKNLKNDINTFKLIKKNNYIESFKLSHPNTKTCKKYSCLLLNSIDSNISDELNDFCDNKFLHSIKLDIGDYIINYSITLETINSCLNNSCEIFLATQINENNKKKFKSIIGTFISTNSLNINNTILYNNLNSQNLFIIIKLNNCFLNHNKNLLKIIKLN